MVLPTIKALLSRVEQYSRISLWLSQKERLKTALSCETGPLWAPINFTALDHPMNQGAQFATAGVGPVAFHS